MKRLTGRMVGATALAALFASAGVAWATELEVTHWWTSGGEAAAVAEFAKAFDATGDKWIDGAIAGGGDTARPIMVSRILGGNPMGAAQFNNLTQVQDLIPAGRLLDLTDVAKSEGWDKIVSPKKMLDQCERDGRIWCVPVNIHSAQWMWVNRKVFEDNGLTPPKNWDELVAAAPTLREKGIIPLASGGDWQLNLARGVITLSVLGPELNERLNGKGDISVAEGPEMLKAWEVWGQVRDLVDPGYAGRQWNEATAMVIEGKAAAQIMGDWAQGEFAVAGKVAGKDYDCLPGLGFNEILDAGGDVFVFPKNNNPEIEAAQIRLAKLMLSKDVQVNFNLKKGSLPVRSDIDLEDANDCMKKGLAILARPGGLLTAGNVVWTEDTVQRVEDLSAQFFQDKNMTAEQARAEYVKILKEN